MTDLDKSVLYETQVDDAQVAESNRSDTVPTASYTFQADRVEAKVDDRETFDNGDPNPNFKRQYAHLYGKVWTADKKGKVAFDASWDVRRNLKDGKLDRQSKLWGQLVKALGMEGKSVGEVLDAVKEYPINVFVTESFKDKAGAWVSPKTEEDRTECFREGYKAYNFVQSVGKAKGDTPF